MKSSAYTHIQAKHMENILSGGEIMSDLFLYRFPLLFSCFVTKNSKCIQLYDGLYLMCTFSPIYLATPVCKCGKELFI